MHLWTSCEARATVLSEAKQEKFYDYQKLETTSSFRLLHIEPPSDNSDDPCRYSLIQTTLEQAPPYETLSYVWGTSERNEKVVLEDGRILCVTHPLKEALALVGQQCATAHLWIDQICIDQEDRDERGDQGKIMGQIYSCLVGSGDQLRH
jgi:hypothetical protein